MDQGPLREQARQQLRVHGPATVEELLPAIGAQTDVAASEFRRLLLDETFEDGWAAFPLLDRRLCDLDLLTDGITLTHVLDADERGTGIVVDDPDLSCLAFLVDEDGAIGLAGPHAGHLEFLHDGLGGPDGWLPDDDVLVLRVVGGRVEVTGLAEVPAIDIATAERLASTLAALRDEQEYPIDAPELVLEARARHPQLLSEPQAPLGILLAAQDLVSTPGGVVTTAEAEDVGEGSVAQLAKHLRDDHGLDEEQVDAVMHLLLDVTRIQHAALTAGVAEAHRRIEQGADVETVPVTDTERAAVSTAIDDLDAPRTARALALVLDDVDGALALVEDVIEDDALAATVVLDLLDAVRPASRSRTVRSNAAWVRARALELTSDDHTHIEHALWQALEADPDHASAGFELAGFLSVRGRAGAALSQLRAIEGPGVEELIDLLTDFAEPGPRSAGRNDPCPCGSGRKHKVCCAVHGGWSLADRMPWVMHKLLGFYRSPYPREVVMDVALTCGMAPEGSDARHVAVLNLALFEGGVIEDLCEVEGTMLPADELALLRGWSQVRGRLYELVERSGDSEVLLDLRSGERTTIVDRSLPGEMEPGTAMLAWVVEGPEAVTPFFGVVEVPDAHRQDLLDLLEQQPSATELGRWVRDLHSPLPAITGGGLLASVDEGEDASGETDPRA